ncbi:MAG: tRNA (adenosine(37)-N6)-threonylcarbamoyltransferase complex dimerization subunit type 1 TsaB [Piscinibacter sp.]|uniref:tRNA (adenosine(37)-N6)-threonylcarbamoyltransferase complex dimerization subunit type 1 TsaB n=1 Tax=Piscinibacter sp. TaxID=1903157 RepID=UPI00258B36A3|nr:tRNA (adenosine(37)-N6)-threonylcarbamoyltransferase complex dimerization subunit type 1 TsaB [Piscinibacter sp.]MCW5667641.1 tRNA (adenosine(37)-N6)-threonylcarbamoyltransferase complex dimerization subunit type 1 TsaB [Piscinibacter sp.]
MTRLLAFDTSTEVMSIALVHEGGTLQVEAAGGAQASARLIPEILALLARAGCRLAALDAIAFGAGPGAFTGLRTACSVAQGLALGAGKPVLPIDSLRIVAQDAAGTAGFDGWVAMDARMDEVYAARYRRDESGWQVLDAPALWTLPALNARWAAEPPRRVAGSALAAFGARLATGEAVCHPQTSSRAGALAVLAREAWQAGAALDAARALPVYLRDKVALTTAEREAAR